MRKKKLNNLVFGRHPIMEALEARLPFDKIILQQGIRGEFEVELRHTCKALNIPLQVAPKDRLNKITGKNHQGVIGFTAEAPYQSLENLIPLIYERGEIPLILLLDGVTDVRNFGAIARSAQAAGAHGIVVTHKRAAPLNEDAMKTSAGALNKLPVCREKTLHGALDVLELNGIPAFGASLEGKKALYELDWTQPAALVLGAEDTGIHPRLAERLELFNIPMRGDMESFNVSVAAGIVLYESMRQRILA